MALVSQSIKNLKSGISQQPDILRFPEQGSRQVNGWSSETQGLKKRSPTIFDKVMGAATDFSDKPLCHMINRDAKEQYYLVFSNGNLKAFKLDGTSLTVTADAASLAYVATANPRDDLRLVTVADYTFVTNRNKAVKAGTAMSTSNFQENHDCLIVVRGGQYGRKITIRLGVGGTIHGVTLSLPDGVANDAAAAGAESQKLDAQQMVKDLIAAMKAEATMKTWTIEEGSGFIHVTLPAGQNFDHVEVQDGFANQLALACTHQAQNFTKLPLEAPNGYMVKIVGDTSRSEDAYYVHYDATNKVWHETVGWNVRLGLDATTMPHAVIREFDTNGNPKFTLKALTWTDRGAGDLDTNPDPSFVGGTINDIFFYRNRLGFLSGENVIMSRTANYFKFFPASVANISDDDPIDVAVSHNRISTLRYAVPFSEQLLLWSDQAQFVLSADGTLTSKSVQLDLSTEFDVSDAARPHGLGRGVYFTSPRAQYSTLNRYYAVQDVSDVKNAEDITAHVPNYIENGVYSINGSTTENYVSVLTTGDTSRIYMYKFLYLDETIRQQSWSHWQFPDDVEILTADPIGSTLYVMARNEHNIYMTHVDFTKNTKDFAGEPYQLVLDIKKEYTIPAASYDENEFHTKVDSHAVYGMNFSHGDIIIVDQTGREYFFNEPAGGWPNDNPVVYLDGDWSNKTIYIGRAVDFQYEFSKFLIKSDDGQGGVQTQDLGRLQLRRAWVNYATSGAFTIDVGNGNRTFSYDMTGAKMGTVEAVLGKMNVGTGQFRFSCCGNAMEITATVRSKAPTPLNIIGCGWEGNFVNRARGI